MYSQEKAKEGNVSVNAAKLEIWEIWSHSSVLLQLLRKTFSLEITKSEIEI